jgi:hypothetical protein
MQNVNGFLELGNVHHAVDAARILDANLSSTGTHLVERLSVRRLKLGNHAHLFRRIVDDTARHSIRDPRLPVAGTKRPYRDRTVTVVILAEGFEYDGKVYDSLSSIASSVTGTRWNGFSFFGLNKKVLRG